MKKQVRNYLNDEVVDYKNENQGKTEQQIKDSELMCFIALVGLVVVVIGLIIG